VLGLDRIYINGGRRGYLVGIAPAVLIKSIGARPVRCANHPPESAHTGPSRSSR
jgi:prolyl-tRNA editing enzyme YbaK/EbsC (Cys-tRNA(Pro) deacylase)